jgi:hypothetical protein
MTCYRPSFSSLTLVVVATSGVLLLFTGCKKKEQQALVQRSTPPRPTAARAAKRAIEWDPDRHHLAPEGTFYLMERVSITTDSGVTGLAPGTRVHLIQDKGDVFRVSDRTTTFEVPVEKLTDDVDLAQLVARNDAQSQRLVAEYVQRQNAADRENQNAYKAMLDEQARDVERNRAAAAAAAPHSSGKLDRGAYNKDPWPWIYRRHSAFDSYHPHHY